MHKIESKNGEIVNSTDIRIEKTIKLILESIKDGSRNQLQHDAKVFMLDFCALGVTPTVALQVWAQTKFHPVVQDS